MCESRREPEAEREPREPSGGAATLAVERRSERMDTAYSPRLHEEEPSDAANKQGRAQASLSAIAVLIWYTIVHATTRQENH